jgi:hypothetical protein
LKSKLPDEEIFITYGAAGDSLYHPGWDLPPACPVSSALYPLTLRHVMMLTFRDRLNLPGLTLLFGVALSPPVISITTHAINHTEFKDWYFLWWLYENGWNAEIAALKSFDTVYPWAIFLNVLIAWWSYRNWWFCFSYQVHYCLGDKKVLPVLKVLTESFLYSLLVTVIPALVLIGTQVLAEHAFTAYQCSDARIAADCTGWFMAFVALGYSGEYQRDRLDELDLLADQQRLRPPTLPSSHS